MPSVASTPTPSAPSSNAVVPPVQTTLTVLTPNAAAGSGINTNLGADGNGNLQVNGTTITGGSGYAVGSTGKITTYNGIATSGNGVPSIVANYLNTSTTTSLSNAISYTPPATNGTYRVSANINTSTGTNTGTTTVTVTHNSTEAVSITYLPPFSQSGSATQLTSTTASSKSFSTVPYLFNTDTSATSITVSTTVTGTVAEAVAITLEQLA